MTALEGLSAAVREWCAQNAARYRSVGAFDAAEALTDVVHTWVKLQARTKPGTLNDLPDLKTAVRLGGVLLELAQESFPDSLTGWRWGHATNCTQQYYEFLYSLTMELGFGIARIEREHPELALVFADERAEYARRCDLLAARESFDIARGAQARA